MPSFLDPSVPGLHRLLKGHKETGSEEPQEDIVSKRCRVITLRKLENFEAWLHEQSNSTWKKRKKQLKTEHVEMEGKVAAR